MTAPIAYVHCPVHDATGTALHRIYHGPALRAWIGAHQQCGAWLDRGWMPAAEADTDEWVDAMVEADPAWKRSHQ